MLGKNTPKRTQSVSKSIPASRKVCGYEIKKLPLGAYLQAMAKLQELPGKLMEAVFPGEDLTRILARLTSLDKDGLTQLLIRTVMSLPVEIIALFAELSGIPEDALVSDENIGLNGLMDMMLAWIEVNEIENFTVSARAIAGKARALFPMKTGSRG